VLTLNLDAAICRASLTPNCVLRFSKGAAEFRMLRDVDVGEELTVTPAVAVARRGDSFLQRSV